MASYNAVAKTLCRVCYASSLHSRLLGHARGILPVIAPMASARQHSLRRFRNAECEDVQPGRLPSLQGRRSAPAHSPAGSGPRVPGDRCLCRYAPFLLHWLHVWYITARTIRSHLWMDGHVSVIGLPWQASRLCDSSSPPRPTMLKQRSSAGPQDRRL